VGYGALLTIDTCGVWGVGVEVGVEMGIYAQREDGDGEEG
jgi:hypothetical protein